jgi:hypothetical protein
MFDKKRKLYKTQTSKSYALGTSGEYTFVILINSYLRIAPFPDRSEEGDGLTCEGEQPDQHHVGLTEGERPQQHQTGEQRQQQQ